MKILENVYVKDIDSLKKKICLFKEDGFEKIQVISDFDKTLNYLFLDGIEYKSAIAQIRDGGYLGKEYTQKANDLFNEYNPIEVNPNISFEIKKEKMQEWWQRHIILQSKCGLSKDIVNIVNKNSKIKLRDYSKEIFKLCFEKNIPILILSSAVGDFIEYILNRDNMLFENVFIVSNFYDYDENGLVKGYRNKIIHSFNKDQSGIEETSYFEKAQDKNNIILFGDTIEDLKMSNGFKINEIITIGFLSKNVEKLLKSYLEVYDVVITNDSSFEQIYLLFKEIFD